MDLHCVPTITQYDFIASEDIIVVIVGPQGEGKTWAGAIGMLKAYGDNGGTLKGLIIRDTLDNIITKTIPSIEKAIGITPRIHDKKKMTIPGFPGLEIELVGMRDKGSLNRIQGGGYSFVWIEEAAPIHESGSTGASLGVPLEAFLTALSRCSRETEGQARVQVTMNPGSEEHWSYSLFIENPICIPNEGINTSTFHIPYGENKALSNQSRALTAAAFGQAGMEEYRQRYVEGKFSFVALGKCVVKSFNEDLHRSLVKLDPIPNLKCYRSWDGGLNPTCIVSQITPTGRIIVLDSFVGEGIGMKQLINSLIKPVLTTRYRGITEWEDVGDPALNNKEQSDSDHCGARIIREELETGFIPGVIKWAPRREAVNEICNRIVDGKPGLLLSKHEGKLYRALRGGWHYITDGSGNVRGGNDAIPKKDIHSHPGDAFSYLIAYLFKPYSSRKNQPPKLPKPNPFAHRTNKRYTYSRRKTHSYNT